jgi:hypothetical protein
MGKKGGIALIVIGAIIMFFFGMGTLGGLINTNIHHDTTYPYFTGFFFGIGGVLVMVGYWFKSKQKRIVENHSEGWLINKMEDTNPRLTKDVGGKTSTKGIVIIAIVVIVAIVIIAFAVNYSLAYNKCQNWAQTLNGHKGSVMELAPENAAYNAQCQDLTGRMNLNNN